MLSPEIVEEIEISDDEKDEDVHDLGPNNTIPSQQKETEQDIDVTINAIEANDDEIHDSIQVNHSLNNTVTSQQNDLPVDLEIDDNNVSLDPTVLSYGVSNESVNSEQCNNSQVDAIIDNNIFAVVLLNNGQMVSVKHSWIEKPNLPSSKIFYSPNIDDHPVFSEPVYYFKKNETRCYMGEIKRIFGKILDGISFFQAWLFQGFLKNINYRFH